MSQESPTPEELRNLARVPQPQQTFLTDEEFDPELAHQPRAISGHPVVKLAVVAGSLLPIFVFAGMFLGSKRSTQDGNQTNQAAVSPSPSPTMDKPQTDQREKLGQAEAQLALEKQRIELERMRKAPSTTKQPLQKPVTVAAAPPRSIASPPPVSPPSYTPPQPIPRIITPPTTAATMPQPAKPVNHVAATPIQKTPEWSKPRPIRKLEPPVDLASIRSLETAEGIQPEVAVVIARGKALRLMTTGTTAEGMLQTPIVINQFAESSKREQLNSTEQVEVVLSEPLQASDRSVALPAGTHVTAQVNSVSDNGLIKLDAISAVVSHNEQQTEIALPKGAIQIRGQSGEPLLAERRDDKRAKLAAKDTEMAALNAVQRVSGLYNRTDSDVIINNSNIVTSSRRSRPNVVAGVLQGVTESLLQQAAQRNERAIAELQKRPDLYYVKAGIPVEIYVSRAVQMPRELSQDLKQKPLLPNDIKRLRGIESEGEPDLLNVGQDETSLTN